MNIIELWPVVQDCGMCNTRGQFSHVVPYYCEPVPEGHSEGGYKFVCERCYLKWYYEIQIPFELSVESFEQNYFTWRQQ